MAVYGGMEPAQLLRLSDAFPYLPDNPSWELIGQGPLWKMVRAAFTDPDDEVWRYSITVGKEDLIGKAIGKLSSLRFEQPR
jgi:hypothetical protein